MRGRNQEYIERRTLAAALYTIENNATVRETAKHIGVSKSTIHKDLTKRLIKINYSLYQKVTSILNINREERHIRGGMATKEMHESSRIIE